MSKFGGFIGRKISVPGEKIVERPEINDNVVELDQELFSPVATQVGEENEAVRNLLIDAEFRMGELDAVKEVIGKLVEPVSKTLRAFEVAKSEKLSLQTVLNSTRLAYGKLRNEMSAVEKRAETLEGDCQRLQEDLDLAQEYVNSLEAAKTELNGEMTAKRLEIADLQRALQQSAAELQTTRDENRRFGERVSSGDQKITQLECEVDTTRQKLALCEKERSTLQKALDETLAEQTRISRRLVEADNALTTSQARLRQVESSFNEAEAERTRLTLVYDEAKEKYQNEANTQRMRFEALQARAATTERLLDEARQGLTSRSEELRAYERRMAEANLMRNVIESKLGQIEAGLSERDARIRDLENARNTLLERNDVLGKAVSTRENAYNRAQEKIGGLEERMQVLEAELKANREGAEMQIEDLSTQLQREHVERTMAEGALESARKDVSRLMRELAVLQQRPVPSGYTATATAPSTPPSSSSDRLPPAPRLQSVA
jgi:crescentin